MTQTPYLSCVLLLGLLLISSMTLNAEDNLIQFKELDLKQAAGTGKKIMVSFTADWCLPCKMIKSSLYNDPEIADLVNKNFQPVLIDVDSPLGDTWNLSYNIDLLPSILFTNNAGVEYERIKSTPTRDEFITTLNRIINTENVPYRAHNHTNIDIEISDIEEPESVGSNVVAVGRDIQLGAFSGYASAQKRLNALAALRPDNYVILQEDTNGKMLFKVVHIGLLSDELSISILRQYHENGFEAFLRPK